MLHRHVMDEIMPVLFDIEGGYVNDPDDPGGETKYGIAKRYHPEVDIKNLTKPEAVELYHDKYWVPGRYRELRSPVVAQKLFISSVGPLGPSRATKALQRAVRASHYVNLRLKEDGKLGSKTIEGSNECADYVLLAALRSELACLYRIKVILTPERGKYLKGWLRRCYDMG